MSTNAKYQMEAVNTNAKIQMAAISVNATRDFS